MMGISRTAQEIMFGRLFFKTAGTKRINTVKLFIKSMRTKIAVVDPYSN